MESKLSRAGLEVLNGNTDSTADLRSNTPGGSMKKKIALLEAGEKAHEEEFGRVYTQLSEVRSLVQDNHQSTEASFKQTHNHITEETTVLKDEMVHRFTLQTAENKRLQNHITILKQENQALERRLFALEERVKSLEVEVGGGDQDEESLT
eukprot:CAMPEP_0113938012 /NCGR_PEP_ID=MMETSP1339-20121228/4459_1 /TAXON_ID=94617 /ORGANISM="Fibrocapsa japonica" /LENGTH=150 /DNA_ID=CAMNT_0000940941 /DNA_START=89 /DNA_END=541 /DNA_ORIENTATION=- /assembly_acc=CAM_ASM_000762